MAHANGILVAVDGAQAAGMITTNLHDLDCDFYAASSHKWLFSPKGVGIFYAKQSSQHHLRPLIVANGYQDKSIRRLENYNTRNLPEVLGLGSALSFHQLIGAEKIQSRGLALKSYFKDKLVENPNFKFKSPALDQLSAAIQTVEVVGKDVNKVRDELFESYRIDTRPMTTYGLNGLRISFAVYNTKEDVDYLINALLKIS